jgi:hypothetical protein
MVAANSGASGPSDGLEQIIVTGSRRRTENELMGARDIRGTKLLIQRKGVRLSLTFPTKETYD